MKIVVALDAFKGSLSSLEAGYAVKEGILSADSSADVVVRAIADGGEGTLSALLEANGGITVRTQTVDALGRPLQAGFGLYEREGRRTAIVEAAQTIGLPLLPAPDETVAPRASSYGMGIQIAAALRLGVDQILVALGGTGTTDGGAGLLIALGAMVLDPHGQELDHTVGNPLWRGAVLAPGTLPRPSTEVRVLSDVRAPLTGSLGAAHAFGPQKGATRDQVRLLDAHLEAWADTLECEFGGGLRNMPGAGAAGGSGAALAAMGARLEPGFDAVARETRIAEAMTGARLVVTGEGSIDQQTTWGKGPAGVARLARSSGAIVVGLGGCVDRTIESGVFDAVMPIHSRPRPMVEALDPTVTRDELNLTARELIRLSTALLH